MKNFIVILCVLLIFSNCNENITPIDNEAAFDIYLQEEMENQKAPALAVLIFKEESILYEKYFGHTNIAQNISLENNHLFLMASVSKVITATALLQLQEQGLFSLDDKINDYLSFNVQIPNYTTDITFRMLLTHTSAIGDGPSLDGQYYDNQDSPVELADFLENYLTPNGTFYSASENFHDFEPGTSHEYSNTGAALIGLLVEQISGIGFNAYCKQNIFTPLGMTNTSWRLDEITQTIVQPYDYTGGQYEAIPHYTFTDYPNGGLRSTPRDMFKFLSAFAVGGTVNNVQLLKPETINAMTTLQIPTWSYEMGLHLFYLNADNNLWGHDGSEKGVATIMAYNPTTKIGAIILTNQADVNLDGVVAEAYKFGLKL